MSSHPFVTEIDPVCPTNLLELARNYRPTRTAIVRAGFPLPMQAAYEAYQVNILEPVFIGEQKLIEKQAEILDWDISKFQLHDFSGEDDCALMGSVLARRGDVDAVMKGQLHTDIFMKALVSSKTGIRTDKRLFHIFHISEPESGRPLVLSDAAVNIAPDLATRKEMLVAIDAFVRALGIERPKIAILSATETPLEAMPSSIEAGELAQWAKENIPTSDVSGPLALDLILSQKAVAIKNMQNDPVAGHADAVLVPDIVSGNTLFKSLVYLSGGCAAGIVMGGKVPIILTSRADPPAARLASCALASIISNAQLSVTE